MALIDTLHVENYRSLRSVDVRFEPLTILVGPNGSGKTTLLRALESNLHFPPSDAWRHEGAAMRRRIKGRVSVSEEVQAGHAAEPNRWRYLRLHLNVQRMRAPNQVQEARSLDSEGMNLTNVFATLPRRTQERVSAQLCELVPLYSDVDSRPSPSTGWHRLVFRDRWAPHVWFEPDEVSDGTILLLALLTIAHLDPAPDIVGIEEPEHGLHPYLIGQVVHMLRELAAGRLGPNAVQVVVATHSAELLEFAEPQEVRFVSRNTEDGSTTVRAADVDTPEWKTAYSEYSESLGEMWLSGGLGGVPGAGPEP